ncbi:unnamed protein product [Haemonchus placei]|uniref:Uncharacterized protein n=1 Tax=Haemonchus placei TaxID=6290 RepID=A0A0N4WDJ6_HAEPC|nr:unnamed protein product [Haemonchus placei]
MSYSIHRYTLSASSNDHVIPSMSLSVHTRSHCALLLSLYLKFFSMRYLLGLAFYILHSFDPRDLPPSAPTLLDASANYTYIALQIPAIQAAFQ